MHSALQPSAAPHIQLPHRDSHRWSVLGRAPHASPTHGSQWCTHPASHTAWLVPFTHIALWSMTSLFQGPSLVRLHCGSGAHCLRATNTPEHLPAPRLTSHYRPQLPSLFSPAYSAITPTCVSHFPGAPSDKFIKLRDDTVNRHTKKKKKVKRKGKWGKKLGSLP